MKFSFWSTPQNLRCDESDIGIYSFSQKFQVRDLSDWLDPLSGGADGVKKLPIPGQKHKQSS